MPAGTTVAVKKVDLPVPMTDEELDEVTGENSVAVVVRTVVGCARSAACRETVEKVVDKVEKGLGRLALIDWLKDKYDDIRNP